MTDSRVETYRHIHAVQARLRLCVEELLERMACHDCSKLESPEREVFDQYTEKLRGLTYASEEYRAALAVMKPALDAHYSKNRHHPEYHPDGIVGMNLVDLLELICDWKAATERHADGNVRRSIEVNQKRFGYSDELKRIFLNTLDVIGGGREA